MFSDFHDLTEAQSSADAEQGWLEVEVPHWTAQVQIYDGRFQPMPSVGMVKEEPPGTKRYVSQTALAAGTYKVEVTADGQSVSESFRVRPGRLTRVRQDPKVWAKLGANIAAPLDQTASRREWHTDPAIEWSRQQTWSQFAGSGSRLFLFVRTLQPEKHKKFAEGLSLWNADGVEVTNFSEGVEVNAQHGWLAFCADLPAGGYVLRRGRSGVRVRQQPIYLCGGWETQVFLLSKGSPSLRRATLNMARLGTGFNDDDEATVAAQAIFGSLYRNTSHLQLAMSEKMERLLEGKFQNPWFGILAACTLMLVQEEARVSPAAESVRADEDFKVARLLQKVLRFLDDAVGEHPDVRALRLKEDEPPPKPFPFPPLLWLCLRRVQRHSTRFTETIPFGSLTDSILRNCLSDSPWTAWREQGQRPKRGRSRSALIGRGDFIEVALKAETSKLLTKAGGRPRRARSEKFDFPATAVFAQTAQPKTPVFRLSPTQEKEGLGPSGGRERTAADEPPTAAVAAGSLAEAPLIQAVKNLVESYELSDLPEKISLNVGRALGKILSRAEQEIGKISAASGLPLSRVEHALQSLRQQSEGSEPEQIPGWAGGSIQASAQTVLQYALLNAELPEAKTAGDSSTLPEADAPTPDEQTTPAEAAAQVRAEADRLAVVALGDAERTRRRQRASPPSDAEKAWAEQLSERLSEVAERLLDAADFVAVTTPDGRLLYGNGAFLSLLSRTREPGGVSQRHSKQARKTNQRIWEKLLSRHDSGPATLDDPLGGGSWELKRTAIEDETSGELCAYVNGLWRGGAPPVTPETLAEIQELLPTLTLHTSFFSYGTNDDKTRHLDKIRDITDRLEQLIDAGQPQKGYPMETTTNDAAGGAQADDPELKMPNGTLFGREFWGVERHVLIAGAADRLLSDRAREEVQTILAPIEAVGLADIAAWADEIKRQRPDETTQDPDTFKFLSDPRNRAQDTWHYVNLPHGANKYSRADYPDFTRDDDVVQMLKAAVKTLWTGDEERFSRLNALRLVAHLVGDIHQPVHVGCGYIDRSGDVPRIVSDPDEAQGLKSDRGGNDLILPVNGGTSLHGYWDSQLLGDEDEHDEAVEHDDAAAEADAPAAEVAAGADVSPELQERFIQKLVGRVEATATAADVEADDPTSPVEDWPETWANTSLRLARKAYQSLRIVSKQGNKYKVEWEGRTAYDQRCEPLAQQQAEASARHLADLLNKIWG